MTSIIDKIRPLFLFIVLINAGLYAGLHFTRILDPSAFGIINLKGDVKPSLEWAEQWQVIDGFMSVRMSVFGPIILWSYIITIILFVKRWKSILFWLLIGAFGLFIADLILTIKNQIPINHYISKLDFNNITAEQAKTLEEMHPKVIENFGSRAWFAILGFILVAPCQYLYKKN